MPPYHWDLALEVFLVFGAWCLVFGAWCLVPRFAADWGVTVLIAPLENSDGVYSAGVARQADRRLSVSEGVLGQVLRAILSNHENPMGDDTVDEDLCEDGLSCFQGRVNCIVAERRAVVHVDVTAGQFR